MIRLSPAGPGSADLAAPGEVWELHKLASLAGEASAGMFDLMPVLVRGFDGRIVLWSGGMDRLFGWPREDAVGRLAHELLAVSHPRPREEIEAELRSTGQWRGELTCRARDGRPLVVISHWRLLRSATAQPAWIIECNTDITGLKTAEAELRRDKFTVEQAALSKSRMLNTVVHDLKQPLHVIRTSLAMLQRDSGAVDRERLIARADRSVETLATSLDTLLEAARLDSGEPPPRLERFPMQPLLDALKQQFELAAQHKALDFRVHPSPACVRSDRAMLATILRNLTSNAIKYTTRGSVTVVCEPAEGILTVSVRDTGIGIPPDKLDVVFEEFRRLEPGDGDGLGLGLAIVRRTAAALGHALNVASSPGAGSTFSIAVPLDRE